MMSIWELQRFFIHFLFNQFKRTISIFKVNATRGYIKLYSSNSISQVPFFYPFTVLNCYDVFESCSIFLERQELISYIICDQNRQTLITSLVKSSKGLPSQWIITGLSVWTLFFKFSAFSFLNFLLALLIEGQLTLKYCMLHCWNYY